MEEVYLLLGSNIEPRLEYLNKALRLVEYRCGKVSAQSSVYETAAWGNREQNAFLNRAIQVHTHLAPTDLLQALKTIEAELGRSTTTQWGPREIDIDILLYGNQSVQLPQLTIPHPLMQQRRFTLAPLAEIAGEVTHPLSHKSISQLLLECPDESEVNKITYPR